jgi:CheY-like chemotaxis protein
VAKILLIDDDAPLRAMLHKTLEQAGYEVHEAADGAEGLAHYREEPSDLILTDIVMPEKEGLETILELRRINRRIKIIAMSGGSRMNPKTNLVIAEKFGALRTLAKPFSQWELLDTISEVLGKPL